MTSALGLSPVSASLKEPARGRKDSNLQISAPLSFPHCWVTLKGEAQRDSSMSNSCAAWIYHQRCSAKSKKMSSFWKLPASAQRRLELERRGVIVLLDIIVFPCSECETLCLPPLLLRPSVTIQPHIKLSGSYGSTETFLRELFHVLLILTLYTQLCSESRPPWSGQMKPSQQPWCPPPLLGLLEGRRI